MPFVVPGHYGPANRSGRVYKSGHPPYQLSVAFTAPLVAVGLDGHLDREPGAVAEFEGLFGG